LQEKFSIEDVKHSAKTQTDVVILSTIHQAKGLEWQAVFLMNLTNKSLPHPLAQTEVEQEEERTFVLCGSYPGKEIFVSYLSDVAVFL
jgi:DNA helicase-2/ATP-dependent DNA helicase PcrA